MRICDLRHSFASRALAEAIRILVQGITVDDTQVKAWELETLTDRARNLGDPA